MVVGACNTTELAKVSEPPVVSISSPGDGSSFDEGVTVTMQGRVVDESYADALDTLAATWAVNGARVCEGAVFDAGGTTTCNYVFTSGEATITLTGTDPTGLSATATSVVTVNVNTAPVAEILTPTEGSSYYSDQPIVFTGRVSDGEDPSDQLTVTFVDSADGPLAVDGSPTSGGDVSGSTLLTQGSHFVTMTVTDTTGRTGEDTVSVFVNGPNNIPSCGITSPTSGTSFAYGDTILFEGYATDPDIPYNTLTVNWESNNDGSIGTSTPSSDGTFFLGTSALSTNTHTISLEVSDDVGAICTDAILVPIGNGPLVVLDAPTTGDTYNQDQRITFSATVSDAEDAATQLTFAWDSDRDGRFSSQGANSSGVSTFTYDSLTPGTHTITVTATDTDGFSSLDRATISVNGVPTAPTVVITPDPATSADNLLASVTSPSTDPEGDAITYRYAWYQDGILTAYTTNTVNTAVHSRGENWEVRVYPNDGYGDGAYGSDTVSIENGVPTATSVTISPTSAHTNDTLTAVVTGWSDADGDAEAYEYQWTKNGIPMGGATDATLPDSLFVRDDVLTVTATPWDHIDRGPPITSGARTILNAPPSAPGVSITPEYPEDSSTFTCGVTVASTDDDGDGVSYTYAWTRNGSPTGVVSPSVDGSYTSLGDVWVCSVTASDGTDTSAAGTDSVSVGDHTPPGAPVLSSLVAYRNETSATITGSTEASITVTIYAVSSAGTVSASTGTDGAGNFTYSFSALTRGEVYSFYATATDGSGNVSGASNTVGTEVCDPYDDYDLSTPSGDTCSDAIVDWAVLPDSGATVIDIVGNILDGSDSDWYLIQTTDALTAGINYYRFHVNMVHGSGKYVFIVHDGGCADAYVDCSTGGYTEYETYADDNNESGHGDYSRECNYASDPHINNCDDLSSDYYIEVRRTSGSYDCDFYELEVSNGIW